ncbi:hypothetical protein C5S32_00410, partial [ANME-1 cluster archaeon GoMg1]|nr:hypothetical protein [ANME-1 cluster archaeon GoMg1]
AGMIRHRRETLVPYEKKKTGPKISIEKALIS